MVASVMLFGMYGGQPLVITNLNQKIKISDHGPPVALFIASSSTADCAATAIEDHNLGMIVERTCSGRIVSGVPIVAHRQASFSVSSSGLSDAWFDTKAKIPHQ
jgi:hypothetical protein